MRKIGRRASLAAPLLWTLPRQSHANTQSFPSRPVRIIVPYPPGGGSDMMARLVGDRLSKEWNQPVVSDNRPGADTQIGAELLASAAPDGYTLGVFAPPIVINEYIYPNRRYDLFRDLRPIAGLLSQSTGLVVRPDFEAKTLMDFVELLKKNPDKYAYSTTSITTFLAVQLFAQGTGVLVRHIPYKGSSQSMWAVQSGEVSFAIDGLSNAMPFVSSGKLRLLGVSTPKRVPALPDVPCLAEVVPGYELSGWSMLFAPRALPDEIATKINSGVARALAMPDVKRVVESQQGALLTLSLSEAEATVKADYRKFGDIIKKTDMTKQN